jgi:hypothetical protein
LLEVTSADGAQLRFGKLLNEHHGRGRRRRRRWVGVVWSNAVDDNAGGVESEGVISVGEE